MLNFKLELGNLLKRVGVFFSTTRSRFKQAAQSSLEGIAAVTSKFGITMFPWLRELVVFAIVVVVGIVPVLYLGDLLTGGDDGTIVLSEEELKFTDLGGPIYPIKRSKKEPEVRAISIVSFRKATDLERELSSRRPIRSSFSSWTNGIDFSLPNVERQLIRSIRKAGFPESEVLNALKHTRCESDWNFTAKNRVHGGHFGPFQVKGTHFSKFVEIRPDTYITVGEYVGAQSHEEFIEMMYDPDLNAKAAYLLWLEDKKNPSFKRFGKFIYDGWGPWLDSYNCRESSKYKSIPWNDIITVYSYGVDL